MPNAVTATDLFLEEISGKLSRVIDLLEPSSKDEAAPEPDKAADAPADKPEPEAPNPAPKKAPAKKTAQRPRKQVDGR